MSRAADDKHVQQALARLERRRRRSQYACHAVRAVFALAAAAALVAACEETVGWQRALVLLAVAFAAICFALGIAGARLGSWPRRRRARSSRHLTEADWH